MIWVLLFLLGCGKEQEVPANLTPEEQYKAEVETKGTLFQLKLTAAERLLVVFSDPEDPTSHLKSVYLADSYMGKFLIHHGKRSEFFKSVECTPIVFRDGIPELNCVATDMAHQQYVLISKNGNFLASDKYQSLRFAIRYGQDEKNHAYVAKTDDDYNIVLFEGESFQYGETGPAIGDVEVSPDGKSVVYPMGYGWKKKHRCSWGK